MTNLPVSVHPGVPQRIAPGIKAGTWIKNNDATNAVWLGSSADLAVNNGIQLNNLASTTWSQTGELWARVDTGVTTNVALTITDDIQQLDDPVAVATASATELIAAGVPTAIGVATATQILNNGVPVVYQETLVASGTNSVTNTSNIYDVHQYASLIVEWSSAVPNHNGIFVAFLDITQTQIVWQDVIFSTNNDVTSKTVRLNVKGYYFAIGNQTFNPVNTTITYAIYGTNRPQVRDISNEMFSGEPLSYAFVGLLATAGITYPLTNQGRALQHLEGPVYASFRVVSATPGGIFVVRWTDLNGTVQIADLCDTNEMHAQATLGGQLALSRMMALPRGANDIAYFASVTSTQSLYCWMTSAR